MLYAVICRDKPGHLQTRLDTRAAHLAYIEATGIVRRTGSGLCVSPEDPQAMAEAIARLADAPDEVARFRRQARQAAPQFSRDTQAERMLEAFAAAISRKSDG